MITKKYKFIFIGTIPLSNSDMNIELPLFPLKLVAFPGEKLNLHIFEPRYKQLVNECHSLDMKFGIPPVREDRPHYIGTAMKILEISRIYPDGKMDIKTKGLQTFKLIDFSPLGEGKLYPVGTIEFIEDKSISDIVLAGRVINLVSELYDLMKINNPIPELNSEFRIGTIIHKIGLNFEQEIELLEIDSEIERLEYVESHLLKLIPVVGQMEQLRKKIQMNGHFKNVIPPDFSEGDIEGYED